MPSAQAKKKSAEPDTKADPDRLIRQQAGRYRTADERFEVEQSATGWFLVDTSITNELGQPLMHGPMPTLDAVRSAIPGARDAKAPSALKAAKQPKGVKAAGAAAAPTKQAARPPERTWIDELPASEAQRVRALVRRLEQEGFADASDVARADYQGLLPVVATRLIERRLDALLDELPEGERDRARRLIRRVAEILSSGGADSPQPLPRWALFEQRGVGEPDGRRIVLLGAEKRRR